MNWFVLADLKELIEVNDTKDLTTTINSLFANAGRYAIPRLDVGCLPHKVQPTASFLPRLVQVVDSIAVPSGGRS